MKPLIRVVLQEELKAAVVETWIGLRMKMIQQTAERKVDLRIAAVVSGIVVVVKF